MLDRLNDLLDILIQKTRDGEIIWEDTHYYKEDDLFKFVGIFLDTSTRYKISRLVESKDRIELSILYNSEFIEFTNWDIPTITEKLRTLFLEAYFRSNKDEYNKLCRDIDDIILSL